MARYTRPATRAMATRAARATALAGLGVTALASCARRVPTGPLPSPAEVRAVWVARYTLNDPDSVRAMVRRADAAGLNTLIVQVRARGDAFYRPRWEPRAASLRGGADYDPLALVIREAHRRGLAVHAWLNTLLVADADGLPRDPSHIVRARPDLLAVPRPLARRLYGMDPREPAYVEALAEYARENRDRVEGLYTSPAAPEVSEHVYSIWMDIVERYDVDGMHLDYVRYPAPEYDYSRLALDRFRRWLVPHLPDSTAARFRALAEQDPLVFADSFPEAWSRFRRQQVTGLVERLYYGVKKRKPGVTVSAAVFADAQDAYANRFQDWHRWVRLGILDVACPMAYTADTDEFRRLIADAVEAVGRGRVWAGIGTYLDSVGGTLEKIRAARRLGVAGFALFSYDFLAHAADDDGATYLDRIGEHAGGRAARPSRR